MSAQNTIESALLFVFKKCPLSTQTFLRTFRQDASFSHTFRQGNALVHALTHRARKSSPLLVLMKSVSFDFHDCSIDNSISSKKKKHVCHLLKLVLTKMIWGLKKRVMKVC